jgi:hypothetical protein
MLKVIKRPKSPFFYIRGTTPQGGRIEESAGVTDEKSHKKCSPTAKPKS